MQMKFKNWIVSKLNNIKASSYAISAGFACGAMVSFTPFVGFHTLLAVITAFLCRGNLVAAVIGTAVGNPWTFPFIWSATLFTGRDILKTTQTAHVDFLSLFGNLWIAVKSFDFQLFARDIWPILHPMMIGCIPYCVIVWIVSFYSVKKTIKKIRGINKK